MADIALENAWRIARAHGHHWAAQATPRNLEIGHYILQHRPDLAGRSYSDVLELRAVFGSLDLLPESSTEDMPPQTYEDARALGALPTVTGSGIKAPVPDERGVYRGRTGTGRLSWECRPDGTVSFVVWRPLPGRQEGSRDGYPVLRAFVESDGALTVEMVAAHRSDHRSALFLGVGAVTSAHAVYRVAEDCELYRRYDELDEGSEGALT